MASLIHILIGLAWCVGLVTCVGVWSAFLVWAANHDKKELT